MNQAEIDTDFRGDNHNPRGGDDPRHKRIESWREKMSINEAMKKMQRMSREYQKKTELSNTSPS